MINDYDEVLDRLKSSLNDKDVIKIDDINDCIEKINIIIKNDLFMPKISLKELDDETKRRLRNMLQNL